MDIEKKTPVTAYNDGGVDMGKYLALPKIDERLICRNRRYVKFGTLGIM
jgi:hypothetical protein